MPNTNRITAWRLNEPHITNRTTAFNDFRIRTNHIQGNNNNISRSPTQPITLRSTAASTSRQLMGFGWLLSSPPDLAMSFYARITNWASSSRAKSDALAKLGSRNLISDVNHKGLKRQQGSHIFNKGHIIDRNIRSTLKKPLQYRNLERHLSRFLKFDSGPFIQ
ncbi:hypothetical protein C1646_749321 [Rhizophagus diaphanus]|nr:hypothetical protein C1646_749321 [Rhizophagus diaphanus] [Rhizophagus sp. MUCL 43196]